MVLRQLSKHFFHNLILNNGVFAVFFHKLSQIYMRYGVDASDDVTTPKAIRCANDKIFCCFDIS